MNEMQKIFNYEGKQVRTVVVNKELMFIAKDVCEILEHTNSRVAISRLDEDEVRKVYVTDAMGRDQETNAVTEAGLYSLVITSNLPEAKTFKRWITHEVIPTIHKHGAYMTPEKIAEVLLNPDTIIRLAQNLKAEQEKNHQLTARVAADAPRVLFAQSVESSKTSILVGELAKIINQNGGDIGQNRLFEWLRQNGYLINRKGSDYNMPTQRSMDLGLFEIKETTINKPDGSIHISKTTKVTGKGQVYFVNKLVQKSA